jgi:vacuolar-type H+-ATPase catalytic subunit A/Vma1
MSLLEQEAELLEIVRLVGAEALSPQDRLALETARSIREDFLHQNAFHDVDTFTSMAKQYEMLKTILHFHKEALAAIDAGIETTDIFKLPVREEIARAKYIPETAEQIQKLEEQEKDDSKKGKKTEEQLKQESAAGTENIAKIREKITAQMKKLQTSQSGTVKSKTAKAEKDQDSSKAKESDAVEIGKKSQ